MKHARFYFYFLTAVLVTFGGFEYVKLTYGDPHHETITVKEKTVGISKQGSNYLIYSEDEVYMVQDLLFCGFFESSDIYRTMEVGKTYSVRLRGRRFPFFSTYKNIISAVEEK